MPLTTREGFKTYAGITGTAADAALDLLIPEVDELLKGFAQQRIERAEYTEYHDGNHTPFIRLRQRPVRQVLGVWLDPEGFYGSRPGSFAPSTLLVAGTDYALVPDQPDNSSRSGTLTKLTGDWPGEWSRPGRLLGARPVPGRGNIKVTYVAGYNLVPKDVELAANLTIAHVRRSRKHGMPLQAESFEDYSYTLAPGLEVRDIPPAARAILLRYRPMKV